MTCFEERNEYLITNRL